MEILTEEIKDVLEIIKILRKDEVKYQHRLHWLERKLAYLIKIRQQYLQDINADYEGTL